MELLDQILALWSDLEHCANGRKINIFAFFKISSTFWQPVALETFENNSAHEITQLTLKKHAIWHNFEEKLEKNMQT